MGRLFACSPVLLFSCSVLCLTLTMGVVRAAAGQAKPKRPPIVFGAVVAVRGDVLQMSSMGEQGLTRVILAPHAMIVRDEKLATDALKPGMHVSGSGQPIEGTGVNGVPLKLELHSLMILDGGMGASPFAMFGDRQGPLMRGQADTVFHKQNYSGETTFDGRVKSVDPLVFTDEQGNTLPIVVASDLEVHQRKPRPIREGDLTAGAQLMAMGEYGPDGLVNAHMIMLFGAGGDRGSVSGTIVSADGETVTVRPRFAPDAMKIAVAQGARFYNQENLDLDSIQVGDRLAVTGRVTAGDARAPKALVLRSLSPADNELPDIGSEGGGFMGGRSATATVKGKVTAFDPLRVQTDDGYEVTIVVPGQIAYVRYQPLQRDALKPGQKVVLAGKQAENGIVADTIVVVPALAMGLGF